MDPLEDVHFGSVFVEQKRLTNCAGHCVIDVKTHLYIGVDVIVVWR